VAGESRYFNAKEHFKLLARSPVISSHKAQASVISIVTYKARAPVISSHKAQAPVNSSLSQGSGPSDL